MRKHLLISLLVAVLAAGCKQHSTGPSAPKATAVGAALVEVSGGKQVGGIGASLEQPVVVQVNDAQGAVVQGAAVRLQGPADAKLDPESGLTDSNGQFTSQVNSPGTAGHYQLVASTNGGDGKPIELKLDEVALGYEQTLGRQLNLQYCARCHDPESTPERVSNMDNLDPKPHAFAEGDALNKISEADLISIITHGGAALNKSASMPPYGYTLNKTEIQALITYIRAVADPPYRAPGTVYANK